MREKSKKKIIFGKMEVPITKRPRRIKKNQRAITPTPTPYAKKPTLRIVPVVVAEELLGLCLEERLTPQGHFFVVCFS